MVQTNTEIAELLRAVAASYELKDEAKNKFRIIAYERAADAVEHESSELKDLWDEDKLDDVPGIGKSISLHLNDLFKNGHSKHFDQVLKGLPTSIFKLMEVPGIGVKTAYKLVKNFNIGNKNPIEDLEKIARDGKIQSLEGFGEESQKDILLSISQTKKRVKRYLLPYATQVAREVINWLKKEPLCIQIESLGSLRRKASTVGDIDIAVATNNSKQVLKHFVDYPHTLRVLENGDTNASIVVTGGMQIDIMTQPISSFGTLLQHFTGSKHHNIALREFAIKKGFSLSEYGIKDLRDMNKELRIFDSEQKLYKYLGMAYIPPELREDSGEIKAAINNKLPKPVQLNEVFSDLQIHSDFNIETSHDNGLSSMEQIIDKANYFGYQYIAFTEHNPSKSRHNEKQIIDLLKRKKKKIKKLNLSMEKSSMRRVFNSLEIDILPNGELPITDSAMELLDFALVSIHSSFDQDKQSMTERIIKGLSHPKVKILAHPTGRLLQKREGIEADWDEIFKFCVKNKKWVEINADPMRLDLPDFLIKEALSLGVKFTLGTDSHHVSSMENMIWGVSVAGRGWLEKKDIVNCLCLGDFEKMIQL